MHSDAKFAATPVGQQVTNLDASAIPCPLLSSQVGALAELLVLLGHSSDAALLQQRLSALVAAQAAAAADVVAHPPPGLALALPRPQLAALQAAAGPAAAAAVAGTLAEMPGLALQQRVAAAEAAVRESHWKWDILRDVPGGSNGSSSSGGGDGNTAASGSTSAAI